MKNLEIERKFLVDVNKIPYDLLTLEKKEIEQGYILHNPAIRIRAISNSEYYMTFKSSTDNSLVRNEIDGFIAYLDELFGQNVMKECIAYLNRPKIMI